MTSYFDDHTRAVSELSAGATDEEFLDLIEDIEQEVIREVSLATGDREFPDDLREKIQRLIARYRVTPVLNRPLGEHDRRGGDEKVARQTATATRTLPLLSELHSAFHAVGSRRHQTRFGLLSDNPAVILAARDDHDSDDRYVVKRRVRTRYDGGPSRQVTRYGIYDRSGGEDVEWFDSQDEAVDRAAALNGDGS